MPGGSWLASWYGPRVTMEQTDSAFLRRLELRGRRESRRLTIACDLRNHVGSSSPVAHLAGQTALSDASSPDTRIDLAALD
jgi:hypothetical protein